MSIAMLERGARVLAPFLDEVAFVGGATVGLWLTDPAAPEPRPTKDVDVVVEVASRLAWHNFEDRLRARGLHNDSSSRVICRWVAGAGEDELLIDVMPSDASLLGSRTVGSDRRSIKLKPSSCLPASRSVRSRRPT